MPKISCVIPVYNEAGRIAQVLALVTTHPLINEVIVVDDGSTDGTAAVVAQFPAVHNIRHSVNRGKTQALYTGLKAATGDYLFLLDADLVGLTEADLTALLEPVITGRAAVAISLRRNSPRLDRLIGIDIFSGDRVFAKKIIAGELPAIAALARFGFESFFNKLIIANRLSLKVVDWKDVVSPWKYQKQGAWRGLKGDLFMIVDILKTISVFEVVYQFIKLTSLRVE